jgi:hypothetical protein
MDYLTNYYKNLCENLQNEVKVLQKQLNEAAGPPGGPPPQQGTQRVNVPLIQIGGPATMPSDDRDLGAGPNFPPVPWEMIFSKAMIQGILWALFWTNSGYTNSDITPANVNAAIAIFQNLLQANIQRLQQAYYQSGDPNDIWKEWEKILDENL